MHCNFLFLLRFEYKSCYENGGNGCIHDKMENRFYWVSTRETENTQLVKEIGGPRDYCLSLGLSLTQNGSSLWLRALELEKKKFGDSVAKNNAEKVICHEPKWS